MKNITQKQPLILLFGGAYGVYIPQMFAEQCHPEGTYWRWNYQRDREDLRNPENENYWEAWEDVLNEAYYIDPANGIKYVLHQDDDLWAIQDGYSYENGELVDPEGNVVEF